MKKLDFLPNLRNRYSIRRFTIGTASILIGSLLFLGHNGEAKAAETINDNNTVVEASNESSTSQQAPVENNKTLQEKPVEVTQQQTDNTPQTKNTLEETKQIEPETTAQAVVEKAKATEQATVLKEEQVQVQKTENSKESAESTVEKTPAAPTEAEPVKEEVRAEQAQPTVTEEKATTEATTPSTEPTIEKPAVVSETPALTPEQKVEKVKQDLSSEYDNAKVDEVLAVIDTTDLTPEQLKSEVLRILLEQASAQKDLYSPQATLPRTSEEASSFSTRAVPTSRDKRKLDSAIASAEALGQLNSDNPVDKQIQEKLAAAQVVKADTAATQEQVQTATTELTAAVTQKLYNVALQRLKDALVEAKKLDTTLYTPLSANSFKTAINDGELRIADPKSTPASLEKRITALETAKSSLILIPNKDELKKAIDKAKSLGALNYADAEDNGVGVQLDLASQIYSYSESTQTEVDDKTASLTKAINLKLYQDAFDRLNEALKDAKTINQVEYTPATAVPFDNAIKAGDTQAADTSSSPEQLDAATKSIQDTKAQLQRLADKTELNQAIQNAEGIGKLDATDPEDKAVQDKLETAKTVVADNNATQDQVKTATNELNNSVKHKLYQDALDELNATIQDAEKVNKDDYTLNSVTPFDLKLALGKMQAADTNASPEALYAASKAIKDAKTALVQRADKTGLNQSITTAEAIQPLEAGNPEDDALKAALNNAKTVQGDLNTDQPTVDNAKIELDNAIKAKQDKDAQARQTALDELRTELTKAGGINQDGYTTSSTTRLTSAISAGNTILGTPGSKTTAEIKAAAQAVRDAQTALVKQPDKTALKTAINTANGYNNLNPNNPVDKTLQEKLAAANAVNTNGDATPEQVKTASDDLNNALVAKKAQDDQLAKDAAAKQAALDTLNTELNKVKGLDKATYTPNTVTPLTEKQAAAQAIADAPNAKTTEEINEATKALQDAQAALVPKANKTDLQTAINTANALGNLDAADKEDKAVQDAVNAAQTVNQDDNATPQQVADAAKAINDAVATKTHQDALDKLNKALQDVAKIDKADYTADSVKPFDTAVEAGKTLAGNNTSTVEALNNATKAVQDAAAQLVPDKSKLDTVLNEAKALEPLTDSTTDQLLKNALNAAETVKNNPSATPEEIKTATWNLEDEINNKKAADAIDSLKSAVTKANGLNEAKYTPNTFEPLKAAITAGQNIINNPSSADTPATLAKAKEIEQLVGALKERADKTELGNVLDKAIAYGDLNPNDAEDKALQVAITAGQKVDGDGNATPEEVTNAVKAINDAIAVKDRQDALDELNKVINDAKAVNKTDYKPNTVTPFETAVTAGETAKNDATKTVEELKAATKAITDAKAALDKKADKTELNTSVTTAENLGTLNTKDTEDKAVQDALDKAKTVQADQNATQEAVNTAKTELDNAVNAKKVQDAKDAQAKQEALTALKAELEKVKTVDKTVYTPNTVTALTEKETAGSEIAAAPETKTTEEINNATQALKDAQTALVKKADKTELQTALDKANTFTDLAITDKEDKAVQDAIEAGNTVKADDNATVEQVENAVKAINHAVAAKERQDALDALNKVLKDANTVNKTDYKPNTVTPFETAVTAGETAKNDATKTVEELKAATKAITDAKAALDKKADKTELNTSVTTAENLGALDTKDTEDKAVQTALDKAKTVQADQNATQEAVNTAKTELDNALNAKKAQDTKEAIEKQNALNALKAELEKAKSVNKELYTTNSVKVLTDSETAGQTVVNNATSKTTQEIEQATKALKDAQANLVTKADKSELVKALEKAKTLGNLVSTDKEDKAVQDAVKAGQTVNENHNATVEQVANATKAINDAITAKERQDALDVLTKAIKEANAIVKADYKPKTVTKLEEAVKAGETARADATQTVEALKAAAKTITDAQNKLEVKANKEALNKVVKTTETLVLNPADKEDKVVQYALNTAKNVQLDQNASQEVVNKAKTDLENAVQAKITQDKADQVNAELEVLKKELKKVSSIDKYAYTPNSVEPLTQAEEAGQTIVNHATGKTVEEINKATQILRVAQKHLVEKADKVELDKVIDTAENTELNVNNKEDKAVKEALDKAITVQKNYNATQHEVNKAQSELAKALQTKATQDKADQEKVQAFNKALEALKTQLTSSRTVVKDHFTPNSVTPFKDAQAVAQGIVNNPESVTKDEVVKATEILKSTQSSLVTKADKSELEKVIKTAESTELNVNNKEDKAVKEALVKAVNVHEDQNVSQEAVNKATSDLIKAIDNKVAKEKAAAFNKALEALKTQLTSSRTVVKDHFTPNSVTPFEEAQAVAQGIVNNPESVTKDEVVKATENLKSTQSSLVTKADKSELEKVIKTAKELKLNVADKEDNAVKEALAKAVNVHEDQNATQEAVNKATSDLTKAIDNKVAKEKAAAFNKALEALKTQLTSSRTVVKDHFTPNSVTPFEEAQAVAQGIVNNPESVTKDEVVKATEILKSTQSSLVTKADKSELEKVIKTVESTELNVNNKEDKAVKEVLAKAVNVHEDQNATQEEVNKATSDLNKALKAKSVQDKADQIAKAKADALGELEKALDKAKAIDKSKYTKDSVEKLDKAVVGGRSIVEKAGNVSTHDINVATKAVETAVNGLEKVKASETEKTTETKSHTVQANVKSNAKAQGKQTSKATKASKNKAKALPNTGQDVSSIDPQYASLMFAIGGLMMFFRKRKNEDKDNTEK